jgi:predicted metal-dependent phosphotriesterase family hydrolase
LLIHNLLASYSHLRNNGDYHWTHAFLRFVRQIKHNGADQPSPKLKVAA